ncbi:MAG: hypothetical protein MUF49_00250 [Oculatellaceae cyanobacterium Prado106]|nr:hypothetical protein [Oculatellaceae cyanobacterium Prado106]
MPKLSPGNAKPAWSGSTDLQHSSEKLYNKSNIGRLRTRKIELVRPFSTMNRSYWRSHPPIAPAPLPPILIHGQFQSDLLQAR